MKVFISADIEGTTLTSRWDETHPVNETAKARPFIEQMTREVKAACEGAIAAGATEIVVKDAHGPGVNLDLSQLPRQPYREGDVRMVPLRLIAEALGYRVGWDAQTGAITVDDDYIQKATLYSGTAEVVFDSHLKAIDMSRTTVLPAAAVVFDGRTYVPLTFFTEFLNDVSEENGVILVAPSMCTLDAE